MRTSEYIKERMGKSMQELSSSGLLNHFSTLQGPRIDRSKQHMLSDMLLIAICGVICGAESWTEIEDFGQAKLSWFQTFLELPNGIASHDTFGRVFSRIDPQQFSEHTAIPRLLELLDIQQSVVTIDAIGTMRPIAQKIRSKDADYVLALKANQPTLYEDTVAYFQRCSQRGFHGMAHSVYECLDKDHGRIECRRCWAIRPSKHIRDWESWPDLRSFVMVESQRQVGESISSERRYFISSLEPDAYMLLEAVRSHWGIENSVHWILDVVFNEDLCRIRTGHAAENFALLRRLALNLLKNAPHKRGINTRQKRAGWDHDFLLKTLTL